MSAAAPGRLRFSSAALVPALCLLVACHGLRFQSQPSVADPYPDLLHALGLRPSDVLISGDLLPDPDRLDLTRRLLARPLAADATVAPILERTTAGRPEDVLAGAALGLGIKPAGRRTRGPAPPAMTGLPPAVAEAIAPLVAEALAAAGEVSAERLRFSAQERANLARLRALVKPDSVLSEAAGDSVIAAGRHVDRAHVAGVASRLLAAADRAADALCALPDSVLRAVRAPVEVRTPAGAVVVAGIDEDVHASPALLLVDLGGDDRYRAATGTAGGDQGVSVCVDLSGNDRYEAQAGAGWLGVGICVDLAGDDVYAGSGQGRGVAGVGILSDRAGDDRYTGTVGAQGYGIYGIGVLCDRLGDDAYDGAFLVQGAAGPGGAGILADLQGDDHYRAGGRYPDFREAGVTLSMSQGYGYGLRPRASGGLGILADAAGDDTYEADYFGQGAGEWAGTGVLLDGSGNDRYRARRYAQGAGTHLSAGLLIDGAGDDAYVLWGVGQGCGHDLSVGLLLDRSGDDRYRGDWLAMGAGNANGIGILEDGAGRDTYASAREDVRGIGNPSRDYGSIGLFVDREGEDAYQGPGGNGALWMTGTSGAGIDLPVR